MFEDVWKKWNQAGRPANATYAYAHPTKEPERVAVHFRLASGLESWVGGWYDAIVAAAPFGPDEFWSSKWGGADEAVLVSVTVKERGRKKLEKFYREVMASGRVRALWMPLGLPDSADGAHTWVAPAGWERWSSRWVGPPLWARVPKQLESLVNQNIPEEFKASFAYLAALVVDLPRRLAVEYRSDFPARRRRYSDGSPPAEHVQLWKEEDREIARRNVRYTDAPATVFGKSERDARTRALFIAYANGHHHTFDPIPVVAPGLLRSLMKYEYKVGLTVVGFAFDIGEGLGGPVLSDLVFRAWRGVASACADITDDGGGSAEVHLDPFSILAANMAVLPDRTRAKNREPVRYPRRPGDGDRTALKALFETSRSELSLLTRYLVGVIVSETLDDATAGRPQNVAIVGQSAWLVLYWVNVPEPINTRILYLVDVQLPGKEEEQEQPLVLSYVIRQALADVQKVSHVYHLLVLVPPVAPLLQKMGDELMAEFIAKDEGGVFRLKA